MDQRRGLQNRLLGAGKLLLPTDVGGKAVHLYKMLDAGWVAPVKYHHFLIEKILFFHGKASCIVCPRPQGEGWSPGNRLGKRKITGLFYHSGRLCAMVTGKTARKKGGNIPVFHCKRAPGMVC